MMGNSAPFARLKLFRNPFGELTRIERAELALVDLRDCLNWLEQPRAALQFIGPCGHGKTTHLLAIERQLSNSGYVYFPEDGSQPPLPTARPLLVDEAQRLGWWRRWQLLRSEGPLVIGTHVDVSKQLLRAGFHVRTHDLGVAKPPQELRKILNRRVEASLMQTVQYADGSATAELPYLSLGEVVALQQRFGSNIRLIEHHLYEVFQRLAEKGEPWQPAS